MMMTLNYAALFIVIMIKSSISSQIITVLSTFLCLDKCHADAIKQQALSTSSSWSRMYSILVNDMLNSNA